MTKMKTKKQPKIDDEILTFIYYHFKDVDLHLSLNGRFDHSRVSEKLARLLGVKVTKKGLKELKERLGVE